MLQIKSTTTFVFTIPMAETTMNFSVNAETQPQAAEKLLGWLKQACDEVQALVKVPTVN